MSKLQKTSGLLLACCVWLAASQMADVLDANVGSKAWFYEVAHLMVPIAFGIFAAFHLFWSRDEPNDK